MIITVRPEDSPKFLDVNDSEFGGSRLNIYPVPSIEGTADDTEGPNHDARMKAILLRRHDVSNRLLNLSSLQNDTELRGEGYFINEARQTLLFPALMKALQANLPSLESRTETIEVVTLKDNNIQYVYYLEVLPKALPDLKGIDLSSNSIRTFSNLNGWKNKFAKLEWLVLTGNPLDTIRKSALEFEPRYPLGLLHWFPNLRRLNNNQTILPDGFAIPGAGKTPEIIKKEALAVELSMRTGLTLEFSGLCLVDCAWDLKKAVRNFIENKAKLPDHAWFR